jgi:hypothetical protein
VPTLGVHLFKQNKHIPIFVSGILGYWFEYYKPESAEGYKIYRLHNRGFLLGAALQLHNPKEDVKRFVPMLGFRYGVFNEKIYKSWFNAESEISEIYKHKKYYVKTYYFELIYLLRPAALGLGFEYAVRTYDKNRSEKWIGFTIFFLLTKNQK